jgi:outer membrane protein, heavy metal efflux system
MRTRAATVAVGIFTLSLAGQAHAQYIDAANGLTLEDAVARAIEREPGLRAARAQVDVTRGLREQAGLRPNPSVSFMQQTEPAGTDSQTRVELQWPLDLFRKAGRVAVADREIEVARQANADRERALVAGVRQKYGDAVAAVRTLSVTEQLLATTARQLTLVSSRVDQGASPPLERDMLHVEARRLEADRLIQAGAVERRMLELKRLLGMPADARLALREPLESLGRRQSPPAPAPARDALASRPDVLEAEARVRVAVAQIDRARREGRADVSLFGGYMRMDAGFPQQGLSPAGELERVRGVFHYLSAGAMVTLPVLGRNQGVVAAAAAERGAAEAQLDASRLSAQSEIAAARARDDHAWRALAAFSGEAMTLARQNLDIVRQTYELGRGTLLDVLNEQRRYLDAERAYTDVLVEAYDARQSLKSALGEVR